MVHLSRVLENVLLGSLVNFFYFVNLWDECVKYVAYVSSWMHMADGVTLLGHDGVDCIMNDCLCNYQQS